MDASDVLTNALKINGLLDDDNFLLPPDHPNVDLFTKRFFQLAEIQQKGIKLTKQDAMRLKEMQMAFDYYEEALEEEARIIEEGYSDEDEDDDDDEEEDESFSGESDE